MKKILQTSLAAAFVSGSLSAVTLDFEGNTPGDIVGQSNAGEQWFNQFNDTSNFDVVAYDGGQALSIQSTGTIAGARWIPDTAGELGFTFDNSSSVVTFSFDVARPLDSGQGSAVSLNLVDISAGNEVMAFDFWGMGDGLAVYSNSNASGSAGNLLKSAGISMPTGSTGYFNVSATIDFATNEVTSLLYGGVEQLTGSIALGAIADTASTLGLYFVAPNDNGNAVYFDNIDISAVPEPSSYALIAGALAFGLIALRRRLT